MGNYGYFQQDLILIQKLRMFSEEFRVEAHKTDGISQWRSIGEEKHSRQREKHMRSSEEGKIKVSFGAGSPSMEHSE